LQERWHLPPVTTVCEADVPRGAASLVSCSARGSPSRPSAFGYRSATLFKPGSDWDISARLRWLAWVRSGSIRRCSNRTTSPSAVL